MKSARSVTVLLAFVLAAVLVGAPVARAQEAPPPSEPPTTIGGPNEPVGPGVDPPVGRTNRFVLPMLVFLSVSLVAFGGVRFAMRARRLAKLQRRPPGPPWVT